MKRIYYIIFLSSIQFFCVAQSKNNFVDGAKWTYYTGESQEPGMTLFHETYEENIINGDTVLNAITYKKLYTNKVLVITNFPVSSDTFYSSSGPQYLRYDTAASKVYFLNNSFSTEQLLFDFNLNPGDSLPSFYQPDNFPFLTAIVDSIEMINLFGVSVKKFYIGLPPAYAPPDEDFIIEGMGGANGLNHFTPSIIVVSGGIFMTSFKCFQNGDSTFLPYYTNGDCLPVFTLGLNKSRIHETQLVVYPNPVSNKLFIHAFFSQNEIITVSIVNMLGHISSSPVILQLERGEASIDVSKLKSGIYFLQLKGGSGMVVRKFVKE